MEDEEYTTDDILDGDEIDSLVSDDSSDDDGIETVKGGDDIDADAERSEKGFDEEEELENKLGSYGKSGKSSESNNDDNSDDEDEDEEDDLTTFGKIASALRQEGIFSELADGEGEVRTAEDFRDEIERRIQEGIDERTRRVSAALNLGVPNDAIRENEELIGHLESLTNDVLSDESEDGLARRKQLILFAATSRGMSPEKAEREWVKSYKTGTDIEDAIDARDALYARARSEYADLLDEQKENIRRQEQAESEYYESVANIISNADGGIFENVSDSVRDAILENDDAYDAYVKEHPEAHEAASRLLFALTNGYRTFDAIIKPRARKEVKGSLERLEKTLKGGDTMRGGSYRLADSMEESEGGLDSLKFV